MFRSSGGRIYLSNKNKRQDKSQRGRVQAWRTAPIGRAEESLDVS
jgi:hypothetical protein